MSVAKHNTVCRALTESSADVASESQGIVSACQYSKGQDCKGLCNSGVLNQFSSGASLIKRPKIMVVGDSNSHGPYTSTHGTPGIDTSEPMAPPLPGEEALNFQVMGGYASDVSSDFSGSATQDIPLIHAWVSQYQPDYPLILLGFNNLGWWVQGPDGLIGQMGQLIENAREAGADVKLLVGKVVPDPVEWRTVNAPTNIRAYSYPEGIFTMWDNMYNNRGYEIRARIQGSSTWWSDGTVYPSTWGSWLSWVLPDQVWETQGCTRGDGDVTSTWSPIVAATANPSTAPGPNNILVYPDGSTGVSVSWDAVSGYNLHCYAVIVWDLDTPGAFISAYATTGTSLTATDLNNNHRYGVWVASYINMDKGSITNFPATPGGLPAAANDVIIGGGVPPPPASLSFTTIDATTLQFNWPAVGSAAGYTIYMRSLITDFQVIGTTTDTSQVVGFLYPGIWNYEFCIGSYNGNYESSYGNACVTPPICCGYSYSTAHGAVVDANGSVVNGTATASRSPVPKPSLLPSGQTPVTGNATGNATLLTINPQIGQLYSLYNQALFSLQLNGTALNLTFAAPDTVVRLF
ncbi:Fibronectin type III domain protein [Niveomyces insectorum RCEF 264]|uniref:Fibronectin type III domain protein n=1 Tax=Niveomyces insectorum RCEF 264 TaxID=1081102 RepID=A0A167MNT5_9HYPO|nr:Fibronectin type III domain protein [Niveomyces insectorum RCEF 264]